MATRSKWQRGLNGNEGSSCAERRALRQSCHIRLAIMRALSPLRYLFPIVCGELSRGEGDFAQTCVEKRT
jgi:hypothetical protein